MNSVAVAIVSAIVVGQARSERSERQKHERSERQE